MSELTYISAGINKNYTALSQAGPDRFVYICNKSLIFCDATSRGVQTKFCFNSQLALSCIKASSDLVVVGTTDGHVEVWSISEEGCLLSEKVHTRGVIAVDIFSESDNLIISSSGTDNKVILHKFFNRDLKLKELHVFDNGHVFSHCMRLASLPSSNNHLLLFEGRDDRSIFVHSFLCEKFKTTLKLDRAHTDWVRTLDLVDFNGKLLLASGGQDCITKVWEIVKYTKSEDALSLKPKMIGNSEYCVLPSSTLSGCEGWITCVRWYNPKMKDDAWPQLLTCSLDKTILIWSYNPEINIWETVTHLGQLGGNLPGFLGVTCSLEQHLICAYSHHGGFYAWHFTEDNWEPLISPSGHCNSVEDLSWSPSGSYLLTVSTDETTRLHGFSKKEAGWFELGRPQIHGHPLFCVVAVSSSHFVSGAEEKIPRGFKMPTCVKTNLAKLTELEEFQTGGGDGDNNANEANMPKGASVPALGLSNKAVFENASLQDAEVYFRATVLNRPPDEEYLLQNSLWPETSKLYGHGYEIFCVAAAHNSPVIASACKSNSAEHAKAIIWRLENDEIWKRVMVLESGPSLTITQMAFSPNDEYLLCVSRDRTWHVFAKKESQYIPHSCTDKKTSYHQRVIWGCCWLNNDIFLTVSRDGRVGFWELNRTSKGFERSADEQLSLHLPGKSITAIDCCPLDDDNFGVCLGFDDGAVSLYLISPGFGWADLESWRPHASTVKRLALCPTNNRLLASCSTDWTVQLHSIPVW